jgi:hypothetical protein
VAIDEGGDQEPDGEAAAHVDQERRPGEDCVGAPLDEGVDAVARERPERTAGGDPEDHGHAGLLS